MNSAGYTYWNHEALMSYATVQEVEHHVLLRLFLSSDVSLKAPSAEGAFSFRISQIYREG